MTGAEYLRQAAARMEADGSDVTTVQLPGGAALVGYQSEFRVRWGATKLHLFTAAVAVPVATVEIQRSFTGDVIKYAKDTKGGLRGLQTGLAIIPALVADQVAPDARQAVQKSPAKEFAAFSLPVIVDLSTGAVCAYEGRMLWGAIYAGWIRQRLAAAFPPQG